MKNTRENKTNFLLISYAYNRESIKCLYGNGVVFGVLSLLKEPELYYAEHTPLSYITDEDAIEVFDILFSKIAGHTNKPNEYKVEYGKTWATSIDIETYGSLYPKDYCYMIDYLRSKGYALPFMDISVKEQIEFGWIKLKLC